LARAISRSAAAVPGRSDARGRRICAPRSAAWMRVAASPSTAASHCDERSVESASSLALPGLPGGADAAAASAETRAAARETIAALEQRVHAAEAACAKAKRVAAKVIAHSQKQSARLDAAGGAASLADVGRYIINVSAMEGKFYRYKTANHPHTNMAKAALSWVLYRQPRC
jgi:hypothetical protein